MRRNRRGQSSWGTRRREQPPVGKRSVRWRGNGSSGRPGRRRLRQEGDQSRKRRTSRGGTEGRRRCRGDRRQCGGGRCVEARDPGRRNRPPRTRLAGDPSSPPTVSSWLLRHHDSRRRNPTTREISRSRG